MKLLTSLLERVAPTVRRDCNYSNIDRVKAEANWDEELGEWTLPDLKVEKVSLPSTGENRLASALRIIRTKLARLRYCNVLIGYQRTIVCVHICNTNSLICLLTVTSLHPHHFPRKARK